METSRHASIFLGIAGTLLSLAGIAYIFGVEHIVSAMGALQAEGPVLTDMRATYGGAQLALGAFVLVNIRDPFQQTNLLTLISFVVCIVGVTRLASFMFDGGEQGSNIVAGLFEVSIAFYAIWLKNKKN